MHELYIIAMVAYWVAVGVAVLHVLLDNRQPAKTMAWVLVLVFVPVAGIVFYLFFGRNHRRERLIEERSLNQLSRRSMLGFVEQQNLHLSGDFKTVVDLFVSQNFALPFTASSIDVLTDGAAFFLRLLHDLGHAREHIHIDMYIFEDDALGRLVSDVLIDKAREGVEVRLVYDDVGCWNVKNRFFERMREEGIEVYPFLPVRFPSFTSKVNYRNHRKLVVIDGRVGYIGGMNIAMRYVSDTWRDTMVRLTGSVVYGLQRAFLIDWYFVDRTLISDRKYYPAAEGEGTRGPVQIVTSSPATPFPEMMQGYIQAIGRARRYIYLETPYLMPTEPVLFALKTAAAAGVDVRLICPLKCDARLVEWAGRSYLREMADAGVQVMLYREGFIHSKLMVCDDQLATCGSTNIDFRSFENNFEANAFFYDAATAQHFKQVFLADAACSVPFGDVYGDGEGSGRGGFFVRLWESLMRLLAPLM